MVMAKAPGKLYLAGEYAVTLPGQPSIIMAVDRFVTVNLDPRTDALISVTSNLLGHRELSSSELLTVALDDDWRLVLRTLQLIQTYAIENGQPFTGLTVSIDSQLTMAGQKLGLGSSAAVVMALIKAYVALSELPMSSIQQYKLGALATLTTPNFKAGSMGDLAAATFGGIIRYQKFASPVIFNWLDQHRYVSEMLAATWPDLVIEPLALPADWSLLVGWTGSPADTQALLESGDLTDRDAAKQLLAQNTAPLVGMIETGLRQADFDKVRAAMQLSQEQLFAYASRVGLAYVTPALLSLLSIATEAGAGAKISGAGGGDNGIALTNDATVATAIRDAWQRAGITPLPLAIAFN